MKLWYGHFIGNFKSPTCPDVPGGKAKIFFTPLQLCWGVCSFWPDLTWDNCFLLSGPVEPAVCMGEKNCFIIIDQACSRATAEQIFFWNSTPHWAGIADFWPRVKITVGTIVQLPPILNTFLLDVGQKWLWMHLLSDFWGGFSPNTL